MENPGRMAEATGGKKLISPLAELLNRRNSVYCHVVGFGRSPPRGLRSPSLLTVQPDICPLLAPAG